VLAKGGVGFLYIVYFIGKDNFNSGVALDSGKQCELFFQIQGFIVFVKPVFGF
jgi:hypothetical protein